MRVLKYGAIFGVLAVLFVVWVCWSRAQQEKAHAEEIAHMKDDLHVVTDGYASYSHNQNRWVAAITAAQRSNILQVQSFWFLTSIAVLDDSTLLVSPSGAMPLYQEFASDLLEWQSAARETSMCYLECDTATLATNARFIAAKRRQVNAQAKMDSWKTKLDAAEDLLRLMSSANQRHDDKEFTFQSTHMQNIMYGPRPLVAPFLK